MTQHEQPAGISRRTVTKAMAWAVPTVAVAATVPTAAASHHIPPPPVFSFAKGCATVGNGAGGCTNTRKTPQVPGYVKNTTSDTLVFQITGAQSRGHGSPTFSELFTVTGRTDGGSNTYCGPVVSAVGCGGFAGFVLAPGDEARFWVVGDQFGSADTFDMSVSYRWAEPVVAPDTCATVGQPVVLSTGSTGFTWIQASTNCDGHSVTLPAAP